MAAVRRFVVPRSIIADTQRALRGAGVKGYELFVLWSGEVHSDALAVRTCHVPRQTSYKTRDGLLVKVDGDELHRLNMWLYEHEQILGAQVHAHPTDAFHSSTDDAYPIVTAQGSLSLVVPDFASRGVLCHDSAAYRLIGGRWTSVPLDVIEVVG